LKVLRLDASDLASMRSVVETEKVEIAFNLAVIPLPTSLQFPAWTVKTNLAIATTFCELARCGQLERVIHCSSSEAYGTAQYVPMDEAHPLQPTTPYAASKAAADQVVLAYCRTFDIDAAIARPFNNFGPRQNPGSYAGILPIVVRRVQAGRPVEIHGDGEQTRDLVFVGDTAEALVRMCEEDSTRGRVINLGSGRETSVNELVDRLLRIMGVPDYPRVRVDPRPADVRRHCADVRLARQLIGFEARPISDERLKETVEWYLRR
jgi:UDP-glucose 4-epimerase